MKTSIITLLVLVQFFIGVELSPAKTVKYHLTIAREMVNFTGQARPAMTINGSVPGPTLRFQEGDDAIIEVHNAMDVDTSIHWHGILLPNDQDGVPFLTYPPIAPGETFTYRFPIKQAGTYWYHSHTELQEQGGLYGSIAIEPKDEPNAGIRDAVVLLSDWSDEDPHEIMRTLKRGSQWYGVKKGSAQSVMGAVGAGQVGSFFGRELSRMPPMDIADVAYDAFLANGQASSKISAAPGETLRLRIIDGSATTYFFLEFAGGPMTIIAADGVDVKPFEENRFLIGVAETYDVLVHVPAGGSYEFRATAHDGSGHASVWMGEGAPHPAPTVPRPDLYTMMGGVTLRTLFALTPEGSMGMTDRDVSAGKFDRPGMNMSGHDSHHIPHGAMTMGAGTDAQSLQDVQHRHQPHTMDTAVDGMDPRRPWPVYEKLRSLKTTVFTDEKPRRDIRLSLDGDMERYVWYFNNRALHEEDRIVVHQGEVARFILINRTMMHHPIHLHGHFFRVINGQGDYAPLKHTVNVAPMSTTVIEFDADASGDWFFHCHLLYHMHSGMARIVHYEGFEPAAEVSAIRRQLLADPWYFKGDLDAMSHMNEGSLSLSDTRNRVGAVWQVGWQRVDDPEYEVDITWDYSFNQYSSLLAGAELTNAELGNRAIVGARYTLPLLIHSTMWIDSEREIRLSLAKTLPITARLSAFGEVEYDSATRWEWQAGAMFLVDKRFSIIGIYHATFGVGAGIGITF